MKIISRYLIPLLLLAILVLGQLGSLAQASCCPNDTDINQTHSEMQCCSEENASPSLDIPDCACKIKAYTPTAIQKLSMVENDQTIIASENINHFLLNDLSWKEDPIAFYRLLYPDRSDTYLLIQHLLI